MAKTNKQTMELVRRAILVLIYLGGTMLGAFNLLAFKSDKYGVYYQDGNQWWFAVGASMILLAWLYRNWKTL